jgi:RNA polymerase sigma-70 factor (ECF subfamily)
MNRLDSQDDPKRIALEALFQRLRPRIYHIAYRYLRHAQDAEDITQEVFVRAWSHRAEFTAGRPLEAWLYQVAINLIYDYNRRRRRYTILSLDTPMGSGLNGEGADSTEIEDNRSNPAAHLMAATVSEPLRLALRSLPQEYHQCLLLLSEERSYAAISTLLDCPVGTVRSRIHRARRLVRQSLEYSAPRKLAAC